MVRLEKDVGKVMLRYYEIYTEKTVMEYELFFRFCREFEIFPEMCNKPVLHAVFYELSYLEQQSSLSPEQIHRIMLIKTKKQVFDSGEYLSESGFIKAIMLCGLKCRLFESDSNPISKVINFVEKLLQSKGTQIVKKTSGRIRMFTDEVDPMGEIRRKYAEFLKKSVKQDKQEALNKAFEDDV